ncbi:hypothetical protein BST81_02425 [Leptolyngbya sp. 'hensonii']|uniref:hypothetical protein n=1 Tax=Leptolyngbya sp. 'hensonii' TaxID=1922337 RepID=UPI00094F8419|nr:hypothetical protein [Leptolyngbya sp. 'hensonii']OLP20111.1 hypothetical protein BST81_02425 [Leptolyngbya sp. 'hensonii']
MKLETLLIEPTYIEVLNSLKELFENLGYVEMPATSIVSPFWNTTFTPSSSEVIFKSFDLTNKECCSIVTCQPCIRLNDLPLIADGWHLPTFHMVFAFQFNPTNTFISESLKHYIDYITKIVGCRTQKLFFTVPCDDHFPNDETVIGFGRDLLKYCGIEDSQIISCRGLANYQKGSVLSEDGITHSTLGPRIEVYILGPNGKLYEIATLLNLLASTDSGNSRHIFGIAFGVERLSSLAVQHHNIYLMPKNKQAINRLASYVLHETFAPTSLGQEASCQMLYLADTLIFTSPSITNYLNVQPYKRGKNNRGLVHQYRKIIKQLRDLTVDTGVEWNDILSFFYDEYSIAKFDICDFGLLSRS